MHQFCSLLKKDITVLEKVYLLQTYSIWVQLYSIWMKNTEKKKEKNSDTVQIQTPTSRSVSMHTNLSTTEALDAEVMGH